MGYPYNTSSKNYATTIFLLTIRKNKKHIIL
jgi:hypothetical protein